MVLLLGKLKSSVDLKKEFCICTDEPQEKVAIVAFASLVVDYTKYLTWMPLLATSTL